MMLRRCCSLGVALLTVAGFIACQKGNRQEDKVVIISPHQKEIRDEYGVAFHNYVKKTFNREIQVEWLDQGGSTDNLRFVMSEFKRSPAGIKVDLFWGGGVTPILTLKAVNLLQQVRVDPDILKPIPQSVAGMEIYDKDLFWFGTALSTFGFVYNKPVMKLRNLAVPTTWEEVGDPKFQNWFVTGDPRHSGSVHMAFSIILQALGWSRGWEVITKLGANSKQFTRTGSDILKWVTSGDAAIGMAIDLYAFAKILEYGPDKIGFAIPKSETVINADCVAMFKGAPHPELSKMFIEYILSKPAQKIWMLPAGSPGGPAKVTLARLSVIPTLYDELKDRRIVTLNPFKEAKSIPYDINKGQKLIEVINDLIGTQVIDTQESLKRASKALGACKDKAKAKEIAGLIFKMPITEADALTLAGQYEDKVLRNKKINEWIAFAETKYKDAERLSK